MPSQYLPTTSFKEAGLTGTVILDDAFLVAPGYNAAMRFRLRTLLIVMLVLGALPWLTLRCLEWDKERTLRASALKLAPISPRFQRFATNANVLGNDTSKNNRDSLA